MNHDIAMRWADDLEANPESLHSSENWELV